jgi:Mn2+/Fe2+ NRAMP family transporter
MRLLVDVQPAVLALLAAAGAGVLLASGRTQWIARVLGALVAVMGVAFLVTAVRLGPQLGHLLRGLLLPAMPSGSTVLVLGLVGTTVVPYNLFLGSALARGSGLGEMRWGLTVAVVGGGVISVGVLVVGTALGGGLEYERLAAVLVERLGPAAGASLGLGLFAAGFTSAITAPLAAALAARSVFGPDDEAWSPSSLRFRAVWMTVLLTGVVFSVSGLQPIPVIILAQAFNGVLLPFVAIFLWVSMNDRAFLGTDRVNSCLQNLAMGAVVLACLVLGARGLAAAVGRVASLL